METENAIRGSCAICQSALSTQGKISALQCGHTFHHMCVAQWLNVKKECPNCRKKINAKTGFIEKLFFDRVGLDANASTSNVNFMEKAEELSEQVTTLKKAQEEHENTRKAQDLRIKSLEKKVRLEKDKYLKEIPALKAKNHQLEAMADNVADLKSEITFLTRKMKACDFYKLMTRSGNEQETSMEIAKFLNEHGGIESEKFFQLLRSQNKEMSNKRAAAVKEAEELRLAMRKLKAENQEQNNQIKALRSEIYDLKDGVPMDTPANNRLRNILMAVETPENRKRVSLGFDKTVYDKMDSFTYPKDVPSTSTAPVKKPPSTASMNDAFAFSDFSDSDDDPIFKKLDAKRRRLSDPDKKDLPVEPESDDFSFDVPVPQAVLKRIPVMKKVVAPTASTRNVINEVNMMKKATKRTGSQENLVAAKKPTVKTARISSFFGRVPSLTNLAPSYVTLD